MQNEKVNTMNLIEYRTVVLAALLHDIGKFLQRGSKELDIRGTHPETSGNFVSAFKDRFSKCVDAEKLLALVQRHHESSRFPEHTRADKAPEHLKPLAFIVSRADNYASSERGETSPSHHDYRTTPLVSVLSRLRIFDDRPLPEPSRYRPAPLLAHEAFPQRFEAYDSGEIDGLLREFGSSFRKTISNIDCSHFDVLFAHILAVFNRFLWCIPSNTQEETPDISLFDHLKVSSAIAACLYQFHARNMDVAQIKSDSTEKFILLVGDIAGIQNFIFDIAHTGVGAAAKRLRSRSFRMGLSSDIAARKVIECFDLPASNILMSAGGKFYALLPNLSDSEQKIDGLRRELDEWSLGETNGEIRINLAHATMSGQDFSRFDRALLRVNNALTTSKLRPLSSIFAINDGWDSGRFVLDLQFADEESLCQVCRKFPGVPREEGLVECENCFTDRELGTRLPRARYLAVYPETRQGLAAHMGRSFALSKAPGEITANPNIVLCFDAHDADGCRALPVTVDMLANHVPLAEGSECGNCPVADRCRNRGELRPGQAVFFQCIAARARGRKALAYLKADVDNLGKLFAFGLSPSTPDGETHNPNTISRVMTLSRMLETFFSGWMQAEIQSRHSFIYTVYSGGDDLLLIGPWSVIFDFAQRLQVEFARFVGHNPNVTLSAGVTLATPHTPVFTAVRRADALLDRSKNPPKGDGRNRLTAFGTTIEWGHFTIVLEQAKQLAGWIARDDIPRAFAYRLLGYANLHEKFTETRNSEYLRFIPMLKYDIARNLRLGRNPAPTQLEVRKWAESLKDIASSNPNLRYLRFTASYALNANRGGR